VHAHQLARRCGALAVAVAAADAHVARHLQADSSSSSCVSEALVCPGTPKAARLTAQTTRTPKLSHTPPQAACPAHTSAGAARKAAACCCRAAHLGTAAADPGRF
jgi:hypothetical protein